MQVIKHRAKIFLNLILSILQVTSENEENCDYLLEFNKGQFLDVIHKLFKFLDEEVPLNSSS